MILLTPYKETEMHRPNLLNPPPDLVKGEKEYKVEAIIALKKSEDITLLTDGKDTHHPRTHRNPRET